MQRGHLLDLVGRQALYEPIHLLRFQKATTPIVRKNNLRNSKNNSQIPACYKVGENEV